MTNFNDRKYLETKREFENELKEATESLQSKKAALAKATTEIPALTAEIRQLEIDMAQKRKLIEEDKKEQSKLTTEIKRDEEKIRNEHRDLANLTQQQNEQLKKMGVDHITDLHKL